MNNNTALTIFNFEEQTFQTIIIDGELWWVVTDVCKTLGIANASQAVENLDDDEKLLYVLDISGQQRQVWLVNQFGLFALILRSRKTEAKAFSRWVRHEVLPSIFATGKYEQPTIAQPAPVYQLAAPAFRDKKEALYADPICPCPSRRQLENAIITTVRMLQPHQKHGVSLTDMILYNAEIQAYDAHYGCTQASGLLEVTESLNKAGVLTRPSEEWKGGPFRYTFPSDVKQLQ